MKLKRVLVTGIAAAMCLSGCSGAVDIDKVTLEDIKEANSGKAIMENHDSVSYKMELRDEDGKFVEEAALYKEDDEICWLMQVSEGEDYMNMLLKDGFIFTELSNSEGIRYDVCWLMGGRFEEYVDENMQSFLIDDVDKLKITEREEKEDYISVTALMDEGDNVIEDYDLFYEYVMNKETLEVNQFVSYGKDEEGKKDVGSFAEVNYDEEVKEPKFAEELKNAKEKRKITLVIDDGKKTKKELVEISKTASFDLILEEGYEVYTDKDGVNVYSVDNDAPNGTDGYQDMTLYVKKQ